MSAISSLLLGRTNIVLLHSFLSFSYRSKVIAEVVSNIIKLVIVLTLSWENTISALEVTALKEIKDLVPFHVLLILFQFA